MKVPLFEDISRHQSWQLDVSLAVTSFRRACIDAVRSASVPSIAIALSACCPTDALIATLFRHAATASSKAVATRHYVRAFKLSTLTVPQEIAEARKVNVADLFEPILRMKAGSEIIE
jgi:hypothetical protein